MKSPMLLFFLFVLLATTLPSTRAENLYDENGEHMISGSTYYMLPVARRSGGGPTLRQTGNDKCPLTVAQDTDSSSSGFPVRLTDAAGVYYIQEKYSAYVQFVGNKVPSCAPSRAYWGTAGKNLKVVNKYQGFIFQDYYVNPGKHQYVIADCYFYDTFNCRRVASVNNTLVWTNERDPWVVKFRRTFVNSERRSWSVV